MLKAGEAFTSYNDQIGQVYSQIMNIEQKIIGVNRKVEEQGNSHGDSLTSIQTYLSVIQPINQLSQLSTCMHSTLEQHSL